MNFFKNIFIRNQKELSKIEYWKEWRFFEIIEESKKAQYLLNDFQNSNNSLEIKKFQEILEDEIDSVEFGNKHDLSKFYDWFSPNSVWENHTGIKGKEIGNKIFEIANIWKLNASC